MEEQSEALSPSQQGRITCTSARLQKRQLDEPGDISVSCTQSKKKTKGKGKKAVATSLTTTRDLNAVPSTFATHSVPTNPDPPALAPTLAPTLGLASTLDMPHPKAGRKKGKKKACATEASNAPTPGGPPNLGTPPFCSTEAHAEPMSVPTNDGKRPQKRNQTRSMAAQKGNVLCFLLLQL
jgi:hypothetical protein